MSACLHTAPPAPNTFIGPTTSPFARRSVTRAYALISQPPLATSPKSSRAAPSPQVQRRAIPRHELLARPMTDAYADKRFISNSISSNFGNFKASDVVYAEPVSGNDVLYEQCVASSSSITLKEYKIILSLKDNTFHQ
jgi:hypothetical protein